MSERDQALRWTMILCKKFLEKNTNEGKTGNDVKKGYKILNII